MEEKAYHGTPDLGHSLTLGGYVITALSGRDPEWLDRLIDSGGFDRVIDALRGEVNKRLKANPLTEGFSFRGETFYGPVINDGTEWLARLALRGVWEFVEGKFWDFVFQNDPDAVRIGKDWEEVCLVKDGEAVRAFTAWPEAKHSFVLMKEKGEHPFFLYAVEPAEDVLREYGRRVAPDTTLLDCLQDWPPDWEKPYFLGEVVQYVTDTGAGAD